MYNSTLLSKVEDIGPDLPCLAACRHSEILHARPSSHKDRVGSISAEQPGGGGSTAGNALLYDAAQA